MMVTKSAATIVLYARANAGWTAARGDFPERTSSFNRSKKTMYESAVTPNEITRPATPARERVAELVAGDRDQGHREHGQIVIRTMRRSPGAGRRADRGTAG